MLSSITLTLSYLAIKSSDVSCGVGTIMENANWKDPVSQYTCTCMKDLIATTVANTCGCGAGQVLHPNNKCQPEADACPDNSILTDIDATNKYCKCNDGFYQTQSNTCVKSCPTDFPLLQFTQCVSSCAPGFVIDLKQQKCIKSMSCFQTTTPGGVSNTAIVSNICKCRDPAWVIKQNGIECIEKCPSSQQIDSASKQCVCKQNYYDDVCTCTGKYKTADQCYDTCPAQFPIVSVDGKKCISQCDPEYIIITTNQQKQCACDPAVFNAKCLCPEGTNRYLTNQCVSICPAGFFSQLKNIDFNGSKIDQLTCIQAPICDPLLGLVLDWDGKCKFQCTVYTYNAPNNTVICFNQCPTTLFVDFTNKYCIASCPTTKPADEHRKCSCSKDYYDIICPCPAGWFSMEPNRCYQSCPPGYYLDANTCIQNQVCPTGKVNGVKGQCIDKCDGFVLEETMCIVKCPDGYNVDFNNRCVKNTIIPDSSIQVVNNQYQCNSGLYLALTQDKCVAQADCGDSAIIVNSRCACSGNAPYNVNGICQSQCYITMSYGYDQTKCIPADSCNYPLGKMQVGTPNSKCDIGFECQPVIQDEVEDLTKCSAGNTCRASPQLYYKCMKCPNFVNRSPNICLDTCSYVTDISDLRTCESKSDNVNCPLLTNSSTKFYNCHQSCNSTQVQYNNFCLQICDSYTDGGLCAPVCSSTVFTQIQAAKICIPKSECALSFQKTSDSQLNCSVCANFSDRSTRVCTEQCMYKNKTTCESITDKVNCPFRQPASFGFDCVLLCPAGFKADVFGVCQSDKFKVGSQLTVYIAAGVAGGLLVLAVILAAVCCKGKSAGKGKKVVKGKQKSMVLQ
ncbi:Conserved_hypothetical protein [Hexamita inflata]|uniref:Uncharacterized protein n=1 Tax=Hexamita inflata TaxID=28002 RepID=A0AA86NLU3_9EUKA|nr:Conserved hypothetical protein [Hexamita inflata]